MYVYRLFFVINNIWTACTERGKKARNKYFTRTVSYRHKFYFHTPMEKFASEVAFSISLPRTVENHVSLIATTVPCAKRNLCEHPWRFCKVHAIDVTRKSWCSVLVANSIESLLKVEKMYGLLKYGEVC